MKVVIIHKYKIIYNSTLRTGMTLKLKWLRSCILVYGQTNWWVEQLQQNESRNRLTYGNLWHNTDHWENGKKLSINGVGQLGSHYKKENGPLTSNRNKKINFRQIKDLNVKVKTIKLLEHNTGDYLYDFQLWKNIQNKIRNV